MAFVVQIRDSGSIVFGLVAGNRFWTQDGKRLRFLPWQTHSQRNRKIGAWAGVVLRPRRHASPVAHSCGGSSLSTRPESPSKMSSSR